jgi:CRP-like cAMP-binding protein
VFLENDKPNGKCYIVLSGRVGVYRGSYSSNIQVDEDGEPLDRNVRWASFKDPIYQGEDKKMLRRLSYYGDLLAKLGMGIMFGDTALMNDNKRNASIVTLEECEFLVFHKRELDQVKQLYSVDFNKKREFLIRMIPELGMINETKRVLQIVDFFKEVDYRKGSLLCQEGEQHMKIYFVQEGEMELKKRIHVPQLTQTQHVVYKTQAMPLSVIEGPTIIGEECLGSLLLTCTA